MATAISLDFIYLPAHLLRVGWLLSLMSRKNGNLRYLVSGRPYMFDHDSIPARNWASNVSVSHTVGHHEATDDVADIYNRAGDDYVSYAAR
jgi:hypothetical protein